MHFFLLQEAAQHADEAVSGGLLSPNGGVMVWTLVIFIVLLLVQREQIAAARDEAQKIIADARAAAEQVRGKLIEQAHGETGELLERARREIGAERDRAIADLRLEAIDLAIAGASRVIGKNLDDQSNRQLVQSFLASVPSSKLASKAGM